MTVTGSLYTPPNYHKTLRVQLAAAFSGASLEIHEYCPGGELPSALSQCPTDVAPLFLAKDGTTLFDANAIAFYVGTKQLRGDKEEAFVTQWTNFTDHVILPSVASWYYPTISATNSNKGQVTKAHETVLKILKDLNGFLESRTFFVGEHLTQADLTVFTVLKMVFENLMDEAARKQYPHVLRWYVTIANQAEVKKVVGDMHLCEKPLVFDQKGAPKNEKQKKPENKQKAQPQQKKAEKPKAEPAKVEEKPKEKEKTTKDILGALPASDFVFDDFKRVYSNEPVEKAMEYLEKHYDASKDSIWVCEYKYADELNLTFMTANLVRGMMQRLDAMRKWAFGIMNVLGVNKNNTIKGLWIWRGTGLIFELSEDLNTDYESYTWKKIELNSPESKALILEYFTRGDNCEGKEVADSQVYK